MVFCNVIDYYANQLIQFVTILILIDGFLQLVLTITVMLLLECHNPYFNRWFSAIVPNGKLWAVG